MTDKLKPCPFCGEIAEIENYLPEHTIITCNGDCDVIIKDSYQSKETAVEQWNKRAETIPVAVADKLEAELRLATLHYKRQEDGLIWNKDVVTHRLINALSALTEYEASK